MLSDIKQKFKSIWNEQKGDLLNFKANIDSISQAEPSWANLSQAEPSWAKLSQAEPSWVKLSQAEPSWKVKKRFGKGLAKVKGSKKDY